LWDPDSGHPPTQEIMGQWVGAAFVSWMASALIYFTLRNVTVLVVVACTTAGTAVGATLLAPYAGFWGNWKEHLWWTATLTISGCVFGAVLCVYAQSHFRSKVVVPVSEEPRTLRPVPRRTSFERRQEWKEGDVIGVVVDAQRSHIRMGYNGSWILAFDDLRGFGAYCPGVTASKGWGLQLLKQDDPEGCGPPSCSWLSGPRRAAWEGAPPVRLLSGEANAVRSTGGEEGSVTFDKEATVGMPKWAVQYPGWGMWEVRITSVGEGTLSLGWLTHPCDVAPDFPGVGMDPTGLSWGMDGVSRARCARWYAGELLEGRFPAEREADWQGPREEKNNREVSAWDIVEVAPSNIDFIDVESADEVESQDGSPSHRYSSDHEKSLSQTVRDSGPIDDEPVHWNPN